MIKYLDEYRRMDPRGYGGRFANPPDLVVIHSGSRSPYVAEYLSSDWDTRDVSVHFAWSGGLDEFVQMVPLNCISWHAAGSTFELQGMVNYRSVSVELPGPWNKNPRTEKEWSELRHLLATLRAEIPSLIYITGHEFIDKRKKDPGPGVTKKWFEGLGFEEIHWNE